MKISIDTKEDSPEDIRKLIRMLLALLGDSSGSYGGQRAPPATGEGLFDMFGSPDSSTSEQQQLSQNPDNNSGMDINDFLDKGEEGPKSQDDASVKVIPY